MKTTTLERWSRAVCNLSPSLKVARPHLASSPGAGLKIGLLFVLLLSVATRGSAQYRVFYSNFNSGAVPTEFSMSQGPGLGSPTGPATLGVTNPAPGCSSSTYCTPFLAQGGLGLNNQNVALSLTGLGSHTSVRVAFSLFVMDSWDGPTGDWERFRFYEDRNQLLDTDFSNYLNAQCFPSLFCNGPYYPRQTGAVETNTLGVSYTRGYNFLGNAVYNLEFTFAHTASWLTLNWEGFRLEGLFPAYSGGPLVDNESWGLDNLEVTTDAASGEVVPEPTSFALVVTGALAIAVTARRRRRAAAPR